MSPSPVRVVLITLLSAGVVAALAAMAVVATGAYDVSATGQHTGPVYTVLHTTMRQSVRLRARHLDEPPLTASALRARGLACFRKHCADCHGAPGVAASAASLAMQPLPQPLIGATRSWRPRELYWIAANGIKMSGMPAFGTHVGSDDLWAIVAFLHELPLLSPAEYAARTQRPADCDRAGTQPAHQSAKAADPQDAAQRTLRAYGCHGCHTIPGVTGPSDTMATTLAGFAGRGLIAGRWPLDEATLVEWIRRPQELDPRTAMPTLGVTEADARLIAGYLMGLR